MTSTPAALEHALLARVEACYQLAEQHFGRPFARPQVSLQLRGQRAGVAHLQENRLRFNLQLYRENQQDFLHQTVAHEVAHLLAHQLYGRGIRPHGREWQELMRGVYQLEPARCHQYQVPARRSRSYIYVCACPEREFAFTPQRHALVRQGRGYLCRACRQPLTFTGEQRSQ